MRRRIINECKQQFPDCPEELDYSCKTCPFYKDALKKSKVVSNNEEASDSSESSKSEISKNQAQPLNINP